MKIKIAWGLLAFLIVAVACGIDTEDPDGEGADVVEGSEQTPPEGTDEPPGGAESEPGTRDNPLPPGATFSLSGPVDGEGEPVPQWEIALGPTDLDATDTVLAENQFNEIAEGRTAVMTEVTATYVGPESGNIAAHLRLRYLGNDGNTYEYGGGDDYCGVIPNDLDHHGEQFTDATVTGNVCQAVPDDVIDGGMWIVALSFALDDQRVFVATE